MRSITRILIIGPSNIGDAILMSEVVAALHQRYPDAHLTLVVGERAKALFVDDPRVQTLVNADQFDSLTGRLTLALALWRYQPHLLVDLRHTFYPVLLKPLAMWRYLRQPPRAIPHMRDRHLWQLRAQVPGLAGVSGEPEGAAPGSSERAMPLWFTERDVAQVELLARRWSLSAASPLVIICPGARSHIKRWSAEGFARVADRLIAEQQTQVVFSGEPDEEPIVEEILGSMSHAAHNAVGLVTIRQLGVLMQRARLIITNDSAALHLASALQVPTIAIFGPTDAGKYGPTGQANRTIRRRLFCAPCGQPLCRFNHECMRFVTPEEVCDAARGLLDVGGQRSDGS